MTPIERLYEIADDNEVAVLDRLRDRAGLTWECRDSEGRAHWTNGEDETVCGECGKLRPPCKP
jgi:hypothetical protein